MGGRYNYSLGMLIPLPLILDHGSTGFLFPAEPWQGGGQAARSVSGWEAVPGLEVCGERPFNQNVLRDRGAG